MDRLEKEKFSKEDFVKEESSFKEDFAFSI
jgi:hypothetical protein